MAGWQGGESGLARGISAAARLPGALSAKLGKLARYVAAERATRRLLRQPRRDGVSAARFFLNDSLGTSGQLRAGNVAAQMETLGWQAKVVPGALRLGQRQRVIRHFRPDVLIFQSCRHHLNRPEHYPGQTMVFDFDDADFHLDAERRQRDEAACRSAAGIVCGSRYIQEFAEQLNDRTTVIWTSSPEGRTTRRPQAERPPVITWAQTRPDSYRLELDFVVDVVTSFARAHGAPFVFRMYDFSDYAESDAKRRLEAAGVEVEILPLMPYADFEASLEDVAIGLSPITPQNPFSRGKSFGKILAYIDAGVPVICSDEADHAAFFTPDSGVVTNDPAEWVSQMLQLIGDATARQTMADRALERMNGRLRPRHAAERMIAFLDAVLAPAQPSRASA